MSGKRSIDGSKKGYEPGLLTWSAAGLSVLAVIAHAAGEMASGGDGSATAELAERMAVDCFGPAGADVEYVAEEVYPQVAEIYDMMDAEVPTIEGSFQPDFYQAYEDLNNIIDDPNFWDNASFTDPNSTVEMQARQALGYFSNQCVDENTAQDFVLDF
jgi:hypothetical protein